MQLITEKEFMIQAMTAALERSGVVDMLKEIRDNTKKPERKIREKAKKDTFDIDRIYQKYPRKIGRKAGMEYLAKKSWNTDRLQALEIAIENYANHCKDQEQKYIKHFSTWVKEWEDWVEIERPKTAAERLKEFEREHGIES